MILFILSMTNIINNIDRLLRGNKMKIESWQLNQRQLLPLDVKIKLSLNKVRTFYTEYKGKVYISYSGGKDSEVMLHLIRTIYPDVKAVFVDTGTELNTRKHAIKKADIVLRPKIPMLQVWEKYGIPFPSKQQARYIHDYRHSKSEQFKKKLLTGITVRDKRQTSYKISNKWLFLIKSDIKVSDKCCYYLKKEPFMRYNKLSGEVPFIGTMAVDSSQRKVVYLNNGCINYKKKVCTPLGFWTEQDVLRYIKKFNLDYCDAYGDIVEVDGILKTTKADRTGCVGCGFGVGLEKEPNRFQRMKIDNPRLHDIVLNKWCNGSMGKVLKLCKIKS